MRSYQCRTCCRRTERCCLPLSYRIQQGTVCSWRERRSPLQPQKCQAGKKSWSHECSMSQLGTWCKMPSQGMWKKRPMGMWHRMPGTSSPVQGHRWWLGRAGSLLPRYCRE